MTDARCAEAAALLRLEISRLPPDAQAELRRLRMTALELGIPEDTLWMFLGEETPDATPIRREAVRVRRCMAGRLRIRVLPRGAGRASRRARSLRIPPRGF